MGNLGSGLYMLEAPMIDGLPPPVKVQLQNGPMQPLVIQLVPRQPGYAPSDTHHE